MARAPRPVVLAVGFGIFFLIMAYFAWTFAQATSTVWYPPDITRWIYSTNMVVAAVFLVGLGGLGLGIRNSFVAQIRDLEARMDGTSNDPAMESLPPPLPDTTNARDHVDRDIDELLESLTEVEATAVRESQAMDTAAETALQDRSMGAGDSGLATKRAQLRRRRQLLGRYLFGPALVAGVILGLSSIMLLGADGFAQTNFQLNTALVLGIGYSWLGVGGYVATTIYALFAGRDGRRRN